VLSIAPAALLLGVGLFIAYGQYAHKYTAGLGWPTFFENARSAGWLAIILLAADTLIEIVCGDDDDPDTDAA
jgi:hypothetical protein